MKVASVVWNPFQLLHFMPIASQIPGHRFVIFDRGNNMAQFDLQSLDDDGVAHDVVKIDDALAIDGLYDVILFQTVFPSIENFSKARLVSLQYGLAKDGHNYGAWRALADMNLMYGDFSVAQVAHFSPAVAVGHPKFDMGRKLAGVAGLGLRLDPSRKTLLYMPTWGALGSFSELAGRLGGLLPRYNVIIKIHHNDDRMMPGWRDIARGYGHVNLAGGESDSLALLAQADLVISDFSGAIFDALYARVPVLLYQPDAAAKAGLQKFDLSSLEYACRHDIGAVCEDPADFAAAVDRALADKDLLLARAETLRSRLFQAGENVAGRAVQAIQDMLAGVLPQLSAPQLAVRETVKALRRSEAELKRRQERERKSFMARCRRFFNYP